MAGILVADGGRGFTRGSAERGQWSQLTSHLHFLQFTIYGDKLFNRQRISADRVCPVVLHPFGDEPFLKHAARDGGENWLLGHLVTNCDQGGGREGSLVNRGRG